MAKKKKKSKKDKKSKKQKEIAITANLEKPEKDTWKTKNPELREIFTPLLLILVSAAWILLIYDVVVVILNTIQIIDNLVFEFNRTIAISAGRKAFLILQLLWYVAGIALGAYIFYRIADWKIRKAGKEGNWKFIFRRITKWNIPQLLFFSFVLMIMNVGYEWSAILMFLGSVFVFVMYKDEEDFKVDKEENWDKLKLWMKAFTILGTALLIWSLVLRTFSYFGRVWNNTTSPFFAGGFFSQSYNYVEPILIVITALVVYFYVIPFFYSHMVNDDYKKITDSTLNISKYKVPFLLIALIELFIYSDWGVDYGYTNANWGFLLITTASLILYIFAPHEIKWVDEKANQEMKEKKEQERKEKAKKKALKEEQKKKEKEEAEKKKQEKKRRKEQERLEEEKKKRLQEQKKKEEMEKEEPEAEEEEEPEAEEEEEPEAEEEEEPEAEEEEELPEGEKIVDKAEEEDVLAFPEVKDKLLALFEGGKSFSSKSDLVSTIESEVKLPEGMTGEEAIDIMNDKEFIYYSRSSPRGWHKKED